MKINRTVKTTLLTVLMTAGTQAAFAACDQTLSTGANVASAISNAAAGSTICLNAGNYGQVNLANIAKTSDVTVRSTTGNTATAGFTINQSSRLRIQNLTLSGAEIDTNQRGGSKNITVSASTFTGQAVVNVGNNSNSNIVFDGNTFDGISVCGSCYEGRLQVIANPWTSQPSGVVISNNHFGKAGESDGIQAAAYGITIGPGNVFDGIKQNNYGRHVDAIQLYGQSHTTITGNYFVNGDTYIMAPDGGDTEVITDNVFAGDGAYYWKIQLGSHRNDTFSHNTVVGNMGVSIDAKVGSQASSNAVVQNNVMVNSIFKVNDSSGKLACSNCSFSKNLFNSSGNAMGSSNVIGTPTFSGGTSPKTWEGFRLTPSSLGAKAATDGKDMGAISFGPSTGGSDGLDAPTNLRVN